jgi:photosystem II stability/assembly factor-like uncharacterized protein
MMTNSEHDTLLALATSPNFKKDKLVFAGRHSGLYRSHDAGKTWDAVSIIKNESLSVTALAFSPNFSNDGLIFAALPGGVAYSNDSGDSWYWTQFSTPSPYTTALVVSPNFKNDKAIFAATLEDGVFRSTNGGVTWESWNFGLLDKQVLCIAVNHETVFAGTGTGLFRSDNDGRSWKEISLPVEGSVLSLGLLGTRLFVGTESHGLFVSDDDGESWKKIKVKAMEMPINVIQVSAGKAASVRVVAGDALLESNNAGKLWQTINLKQTDATPVHLAHSLVGFANGNVSEYL